jgi:hypothetical protein
MATHANAVRCNCANDDDNLLTLLHRQADVYRRLESLAHRQRNLIAEQDPRPLLRLLADRQRLTDELTSLSSRLEPYRARWSAVRNELSADDQQTVDRLVAEAGERLGRIMAGDQTDARLLAARKTRVSDGVRGVQTGQRMLAAYGAGGATSGSRLDRMDQA